MKIAPSPRIRFLPLLACIAVVAPLWASPRIAPPPARPPIDDPTIASLALFGGQSADSAVSVVSDGQGGWYVAGSTYSVEFPFQTSSIGNLGGSDVYLLHVDAAGEVTHATRIGGAGTDSCVALDFNGALITLAGNTSSTDFPVTAGVYQSALMGETDAFVLVLDVEVLSLVYCTYVGGSSADTLRDMAVDASLEPVLVGETASTDFPVVGGAETTLEGPSDAFVVRLRSDATGLRWSTYYGDLERESAHAVDLDPASRAVVVGDRVDGGSMDGFLLVLDAAGETGYDGRIGGSDDDGATDVVALEVGTHLIAGWTRSSDFQTVSPTQSLLGGGRDAFAAIFLEDSGFSFATYFGGIGDDSAVAVRDAGGLSLQLLLETESTDLPVLLGLSRFAGADGDAYLVEINPVSPGIPTWSTYLPGGDREEPSGFAGDEEGALAIVQTIQNGTAEHDQPVTIAQGEVEGANNRNACLVVLQPGMRPGPGMLGFQRADDVAFFEVSYPFFVHRTEGCTGTVSISFDVYDEAATMYVEGLHGVVAFGEGEQVGLGQLTIPKNSGWGAGKVLHLVLHDPTGGAGSAAGATRRLTMNVAGGGGGGGGDGFGSGSGSDDSCPIGLICADADRRGDLEGLRAFRDRVLLPTAAGRALVNAYYAAGRQIVPWLVRHPAVIPFARLALAPIVLASMHPLAAVLVVALCVVLRSRRSDLAAWIARCARATPATRLALIRV